MFRIGDEVWWDNGQFGIECGSIVAISNRWAIVEYGPWSDEQWQWVELDRLNLNDRMKYDRNH